MRISPCFLGLLALAACPDGSYTPPDPGTGELGIGVFTYRCRSVGDPACAPGEIFGPFPEAIALGGQFGLDYAWQDASEHYGDPLPVLQSGAPDLLRQDGDAFTALEPGYVAVLAIRGNTRLVDLRHLYLREVAGLRVVDVPGLPNYAPLAELTVVAGEAAEFQAVPLDAADTPLAGTLPFTWAAGDEAVVRVAEGGDRGRVRVEGVAVGESTLTVTLGERVLALPIRVEAGPPATTGTDTEATDTDPTGTDTTDTSTDTSSTGTDTDTDTDTDTSGTGTDTDTTGGAL
jgi:hypothetical protein